MAKVSIFSDEQNRFFPFDEDTEVKLTYLDKAAALKLNKEVDKICKRSGADWSVVWNQKLGETVVKGWRNIKDHNHPGFVLPDDSPIPFTTENRDMMMKLCREFSIFVNETTVDGKVFLEIQQTAAEKAEAKKD